MATKKSPQSNTSSEKSDSPKKSVSTKKTAASKAAVSSKSKVEEPKSAVMSPKRAADNPIMPVEKYLMSIGVRAQRVAPMSAWAKGRGLSVATVSQWKTLFEEF